MSKIIELIGNTPLVELEKMTDQQVVKIYAKLEGNNPGGSVKDRAALFMIQGAIARKELNPDTCLIEATSGNTGIALAMIAAYYNIKIELVMPENSTIERVRTMQAYGAKVTLTPAGQGMEGAIDYVKDKLDGGGYVMLDQFGNPDNPAAHYRGTGPEIWRNTRGRITHFVSAMGTTGTIMGVSRYLKEQNPDIQIIGVQPEEGSSIPGIRRWPIEYLPKIYDPNRVDRFIYVSAKQAYLTTRELAYKQGLFAGISSGGAVTAAIQLSKELTGGVIVCIICDRGDRYLSSDLFG